MSSLGPEGDSSSEAAIARKRRIAMRKRTAIDDGPIADSSSSSDCVEEVATTVRPLKRKKPHVTGIKKENESRYDPGVSMTKEELKAWRKEARRIRNRESAAASRKKNRVAIDQLETQVEHISAKYAAALKFIIDLQDQQQPSHQLPPASVVQDLEDLRKGSRCGNDNEPVSQPKSSPSVSGGTVSAPLYSTLPLSSAPDTCKNPFLHDKAGKNSMHLAFPYQDHHRLLIHNSQQPKHITNLISRPIACV